jgi:hypothetical protein
MWSFGFVVFRPFLGENLRFFKLVEEFTVELLISLPPGAAFTNPFSQVGPGSM